MKINKIINEKMILIVFLIYYDNNYMENFLKSVAYPIRYE